jgi:hypothetical protein
MIARLLAWLFPINMAALTVANDQWSCREPVWMHGIGGPPDPTPAGWHPCYDCDLCAFFWPRAG